MALLDAAKKVAKEFEYTKENVNLGVKEFLREMDEGLQATGTDLSQIPTYVTSVPTGTEKGLYLAVDLGGTNFRVCSIELNGDSTFHLTQSKIAVPKELQNAKTAPELFAFLAKQIEVFLHKHHSERFQTSLRRRNTISTDSGFRDEDVFQLGFTFSFPVEQNGINKGKLIRWTKGFNIEDAIGKDVCALLQFEIDALNLPVKVAALVNDTVGTLMARSYTSPGKTGTLIGAIFGTGTNGAYVEKLQKVTKLFKADGEVVFDKTAENMVVNSEWGSFDNHLRVLPQTKYDKELDDKSINPGIQMFEKLVSGMFLGEILRLALVDLVKDSSVGLFSDENSGMNDVHSTTTIDEDSALFKQWGLDTSFMSTVENDSTESLKAVRQALAKDLGINAASHEDAEAVKILVHAIGERAARLSAVPLGAMIHSTGALKDEVVDIGVDGSLVEFYPNFEEMIRSGLRDITEIGAKGEKKIRIGIAKDGSGVGAALIALVAGSMQGAPKTNGMNAISE
ncbi:MAG: glucokinase [Cirrosporium novae-zelandiae]|nr:MAG: glucokinase [Cirrosporium novae-zelandiae]